MVGVQTSPHHAYCREAFVDRIKDMVNGLNADVVIYYNGGKHWGFEDFKVKEYQGNKTGMEMLKEKQNAMRDDFLKGNYTHLFSLESDNIPNKNTIKDFLKHKVDLVSSLYFVKTTEHFAFEIPKGSSWWKMGLRNKGAVIRQKLIPSVWGIFGTQSRRWDIDDALPQRGLVRALACGLGSVLISRNVLEKIKFRINEKQFTDYTFWKDAFDLGFEGFVDTDNWAEHRHLETDGDALTKWFEIKG